MITGKKVQNPNIPKIIAKYNHMIDYNLLMAEDLQ